MLNFAWQPSETHECKVELTALVLVAFFSGIVTIKELEKQGTPAQSLKTGESASYWKTVLPASMKPSLDILQSNSCRIKLSLLRLGLELPATSSLTCHRPRRNAHPYMLTPLPLGVPNALLILAQWNWDKENETSEWNEWHAKQEEATNGTYPKEKKVFTLKPKRIVSQLKTWHFQSKPVKQKKMYTTFKKNISPKKKQKKTLSNPPISFIQFLLLPRHRSSGSPVPRFFENWEKSFWRFLTGQAMKFVA